jgi:thiamine-phosphate pyrophosphorylase
LASILNSLLKPDELLMVEQIVNHYQDLQIPQKDLESEFHLTLTNTSYRIVKVACFRLGFIAIDAECIANAWSEQSTPHFDLYQWPTLLTDFAVPPKPFPAFATCPKDLGLYVVAPSAEWVGKLAHAGVKTIQLRFKSEDPIRIEEEVEQAIHLVKNFACHLWINDHWEAAIKHQAYGVHLGQEDLAHADFLTLQKAGLRLGISTHGYAEIVRALSFQPSYIALGAIFPTTLKKMATAPQGLGRLRRYAQLLKDYSLVGIGGVDASNIASVIDCGVGSAALVRAVIGADDYLSAINTLQTHFKSN